jgi:hypothetical protein
LLETLTEGQKKSWQDLDEKELGSFFSETVQGTYGPTGLPAWTVDSPLAPIFKLSRWPIEQANNFNKYVIMPAIRDGNIKPLIFSLFGSVVGGEIIREVVEGVTGRKLNVPSLKEINASSGEAKDKISDYAYNLITAVSIAGHTGIVGDMAKSIMDIAYKNKPQGFNYPMVEIAADSAVKTSQAIQAIVSEGEDPVKVGLLYARDLLRNNIQNARIAIQHLQDSELTNEQQKSRDLRIFSMLEDHPYRSTISAGGPEDNPYVDITRKEFKKTKDLGEAGKLAGELVKGAVKESKGNVLEMERKFRGFKQMPVTTFPSVNARPDVASEYLGYLGRLYGPEERGSRLSEYIEDTERNKVKAKFIP